MKSQFYHLLRIRLLPTLFLAFFISAPQTSPAQQKMKGAALARPTAEKENDGHITISTELVSLTVTVMDKRRRYAAGLDRGAFTNNQSID